MPFVKVVDGVVVQKQCTPDGGLVECSDDVTNGYFYDGVTFVAPPYFPSPAQTVGGIV